MKEGSGSSRPSRTGDLNRLRKRAPLRLGGYAKTANPLADRGSASNPDVQRLYAHAEDV